ncbi:hypothetical protein BKA67DRAFT_536008 [Truncatella angustata]|uniref:Uncharacterized protein n=1 Tax=Truncatella angustata TaxID=152316 RepID=A0A9P8UM48_9PEZI|nr:uncharacterized protein BKA67DRAFT_536008 [Truncatella angustata]KAH6654704.1 hypothetical protein BKA67DRAFT_536008 [Truncatella angustata]KAH8199584.1 hypothetical protein TruAng_006234 [Truncatella angustata]
MTSSPILLILGAGSGVGTAVTERFAKLGYKIALVSRRNSSPPSVTSEGYLSIRADLADVDAYKSIYDSIRETFGGVPNVIVFNAYGLTAPSEEGNIFTVPLESFRHDLELAVIGPYVAAREAYRLWTEDNDETKRTFIYTGNIQAKKLLPMPVITSMGVTKRASYYWLGVADKLYREKGFRFFFTDQRSSQGGPNNVAGPEEHAEMYERIVKSPDEYPFYATFVDGKGLVQFEDSEE